MEHKDEDIGGKEVVVTYLIRGMEMFDILWVAQ